MQTQNLDDDFFSTIRVPNIKNYERLTNDEARDRPVEDDYFKIIGEGFKCDTPAGIAKKKVDELENVKMKESISTTSLKSEKSTTSLKPPVRAPLKPVPVTGVDYGDLKRLAMFNAPKPVERESQRRRSQRRESAMQKPEEKPAVAPQAPAPAAVRSSSLVRRASTNTRPIARAVHSANRPVTRSITEANRMANEVTGMMASLKITSSRESRDRTPVVRAPTAVRPRSFLTKKTAELPAAAVRARSMERTAKPVVTRPAPIVSRQTPVRTATVTVPSKQAAPPKPKPAPAKVTKAPLKIQPTSERKKPEVGAAGVRASSLTRGTTPVRRDTNSFFARLATPKQVSVPKPAVTAATPKMYGSIPNIADVRAASSRLRNQYLRASPGTVGLKIVPRE